MLIIGAIPNQAKKHAKKANHVMWNVRICTILTLKKFDQSAVALFRCSITVSLILTPQRRPSWFGSWVKQRRSQYVDLSQSSAIAAQNKSILQIYQEIDLQRSNYLAKQVNLGIDKYQGKARIQA
jgi:hypothetical protein